MNPADSGVQVVRAEKELLGRLHKRASLLSSFGPSVAELATSSSGTCCRPWALPVVRKCGLRMKNVFFVSHRYVSTSDAAITGNGPEEIRGDASVIAVNSPAQRSSASFAARCKSPSTAQTPVKPFNTRIYLMEAGQEFRQWMI